MKYRAILNVAYPLWQDRVLGVFDEWNEARSAMLKALNEAYPGKWEVNCEAPGKTCQYVPTDDFWITGNYCLGIIDPAPNEQEQLEQDIARLMAELSNKQARLAALKAGNA